MNKRAVFLDKDGTLVDNVPYNVDVSRIKLADGALDGLVALHKAGFKIIMITNQAGIAHGFFQEEDLVPVQEHLAGLFQEAGVPLAGFYYCPHHPEGKVRKYRETCFCRKPSPGMLFHAARDHDLNLAASWFVGDILNDVEAGRRADCRTVLIDNGNETEWKFSAFRRPHVTVKDFSSAVDAILSYERSVPQPVTRPTAAKVRYTNL